MAISKKDLIQALELYTSAHEDMVRQCSSNPVINSFGEQVDFTKINNAHEVASSMLLIAKQDEQNKNTDDRYGYNELWNYFGLSYASWLTLPRVLMHEMPDEWQMKMAELLSEFDDVFENAPAINTFVSVKNEGKFSKMPEWIKYRHPDRKTIHSFMRSA